MKSSSGKHFVALDHVRALAVLLVFTWHFTHGRNGYPNPFEYVPSFFPLALLDEGHTGVSIFMALSGYLFTKLLNGRSINYIAFLWNRFLRLAPLLSVVIIITGFIKYINNEDMFIYAKSIAAGILKPTLPNVAWSITVEFHFYLILPILLWVYRKSRNTLLIILLVPIIIRAILYYKYSEIQLLAYGTIIGRFDQFLIGMLAFQYREFIKNRHTLIISSAVIFLVFYWYFDKQGGFYQNPTYPSTNPIWIILLTIEGAIYALLITYYDSSFHPPNKGISGFIGRIGDYSYSMYLLHYFFVFYLAKFIDTYVMNISNFYIACVWAIICFMFILPICYLSFRFIETPFLKFRRQYIIA